MDPRLEKEGDAVIGDGYEGGAGGGGDRPSEEEGDVPMVPVVSAPAVAAVLHQSLAQWDYVAPILSDLMGFAEKHFPCHATRNSPGAPCGPRGLFAFQDLQYAKTFPPTNGLATLAGVSVCLPEEMWGSVSCQPSRKTRGGLFFPLNPNLLWRTSRPHVT